MSESGASPDAGGERDAEGNPRAWARWIAKSIDLYFALFFMFVAVAVMAITLETIAYTNGDYSGADLFSSVLEEAGILSAVLTVALTAVFLFLFDAICVSLFGRTPGKALMGFRIARHDGRKPGFFQAMGRSALSLLMGLGLMLPVVTLFAQIAAYFRLQREDITAWDEQMHVEVATWRVHWLRWTFGILLVVIQRGIDVYFFVVDRFAY